MPHPSSIQSPNSNANAATSCALGHSSTSRRRSTLGSAQRGGVQPPKSPGSLQPSPRFASTARSVRRSASVHSHGPSIAKRSRTPTQKWISPPQATHDLDQSKQPRTFLVLEAAVPPESEFHSTRSVQCEVPVPSPLISPALVRTAAAAEGRCSRPQSVSAPPNGLGRSSRSHVQSSSSNRSVIESGSAGRMRSRTLRSSIWRASPPVAKSSDSGSTRRSGSRNRLQRWRRISVSIIAGSIDGEAPSGPGLSRPRCV